jgi:hypothetical protein
LLAVLAEDVNRCSKTDDVTGIQVAGKENRLARLERKPWRLPIFGTELPLGLQKRV